MTSPAPRSLAAAVAFAAMAAQSASLTPADAPVVRGRSLETRDGRPLLLQGVNIPSLEWRPDGDHIREAFAVAIGEWHANCIRLPLKTCLWFGMPKKTDIPPEALSDESPEPWASAATAYRALVDELVAYANERGAYVVLDLHEFRAPLEEHAVFWRSAASRYANRPGVLFDLFNEPYGLTWDAWLRGGEVGSKCDDGAAPAETDEGASTVRTIGMQALADAVRDTGARNVLIVGGLDWGYDLSGIPGGREIDDKGGDGVVYSTHVYPWKGEWDARVLPVVKDHPVFVGEVGAQEKPMPFEKTARDPYAWSPEVLAWIRRNGFHWTAWNFHPKCGPSAVLDWSFAPTPCWGAFVKKALAGQGDGPVE